MRKRHESKVGRQREGEGRVRGGQCVGARERRVRREDAGDDDDTMGARGREWATWRGRGERNLAW